MRLNVVPDTYFDFVHQAKYRPVPLEMPLLWFIGQASDLGERLKIEILRDKWQGVADIESEVGFQEVFDRLRLRGGGVEVVHNHSRCLGFKVAEQQ